MTDFNEAQVGGAIHGFASGYFGRDSYECRMIEAKGPDWLVLRNTRGQVQMITRSDYESITDPDDRDFCGSWCRAERDDDA